MHQFTNFTYTYTATKHQIDPLRVTIIAIRVDHTIPYCFELGLGDIYSLQNGTLEGILGFKISPHNKCVFAHKAKCGCSEVRILPISKRFLLIVEDRVSLLELVWSVLLSGN